MLHSIFAVALEEPCGSAEEAGKLGTGVFDLTGNQGLAKASDIFLAKRAKLGLVLLVAWLGAKLAHGREGCSSHRADHPDLRVPAGHSS